MGDARSESERLPWLDTPRSAKTSAAPRRKLPRAPIYVLLSLFLLASVGVMSFLVGRGSVPAEPAETPSPVTAAPPARTVILPPAAPPPPIPSPAPVAEQARTPPAARATPARKSASKRSVSRARQSARAARRAKAAPSRLETVRAVQMAPVVRRTAPLVQATRVAQLGTYRSRWQADAAHRRLIRVYPYVRTLPKVVRPIRPNGSRRTFYRLQYQEYSPEYARILCRNLRAIGRGCVVLPAGR